MRASSDLWLGVAAVFCIGGSVIGCRGGNPPCVAACARKPSGNDGCGGSCGRCISGLTCNFSGQCIGCLPSCSGKACGDNGCGGTCGTCPTGQACNATGQCGGQTVCQGTAGSPTIGKACSCNADCDANEACGDERNFGFPGGECLRICSSMDPCPTGFDCKELTPGDPSTQGCLKRCSASAECRPGYVCSYSYAYSATYCIGQCSSSAQCPAVGYCDPYYGVCAHMPRPGPGDIGAACTKDADCMSNFCFAGGIPGGYCTAFCSLLEHGCPAQSSCEIRWGPRGDLGICLHLCSSDADCRSGYRCIVSPVHPQVRVCAA